MKIKIILLALIILLPVSLSAADFGLVVNINGGYGGYGEEDHNFDYKADFWPRFSALLGDNGELLITAGLTLGMTDEDFYYVPELLHTELTMRFGSSGIRLGRINYSDPLSFIAEGLFDGFQFFHSSGAGHFHIGAWYTGFLYKKNAQIAMTANDLEILNNDLDYDDFFNTYFAPKRAFMSMGWEHPSIGELLHLNTAIIGQVDLSDSDSWYHSQYLIIKAQVPINQFLIELGGSLETSQIADEEPFTMAFAAEAGFSWLFASVYNSRLSLTGRIAGGRIDDTFTAFTPITTKHYGVIFQQNISGLSVFTLDYSSRVTQTLGASATASYFVRNDLGTYNTYPVNPDNNGYFLGPEFSARVIWSPASDLQLNLTGGAFVPALGDAGPKEKLQWRVELTATIALL